MPHINTAGLDLLETFEGEHLRSYPDPGTGGNPWTIGFGHTASVHPGEAITHAQAVTFLLADVGNAEMAVAHAVDVVLTPNQFSALVSWQYNTGAISGSQLVLCLNGRDFGGAMMHLMRYVYANGQLFDGLLRRRTAERELFDTH